MGSIHRWFEKRAADSTPRKSLGRRRVDIEALESRLLLYSATGNAWPNPQTITISFMPDGTNLGGASSNLQSTFNSNPALAGRWQSQILQAAQAWAQQTNINFVVVPDDGAPYGAGSNEQGDPNHGDIRIGGYNFGTATLARANQPPPVNNFSIAGDINFNTAQAFNVGATFDLFTVAAHEFGHALGLAESSGSSSGSSAIMYPSYTGKKSVLSNDEIAGIRNIYSANAPRTADAFNVNGSSDATFVTAANLNVFIDPKALTASVSNLDITRAGQVEDFTFTAPAGSNGTLSVTAQSKGLSLLAPKLTVYSATGTVLGTASGAGQYGTTLTVNVSGVNAGQQYYVQVQGADNSAMGTGRYALGLSFNGEAPPVAASPVVATVCGAVYHSGSGYADQTTDDDNFFSTEPVIMGISPDTGASTGDGVTDAARITLSGTAPQGELITAYRNGVVVGTTTANSNNQWTFDETKTTLADGNYLFTVTATDPAGHVSKPSYPYQVTIDTQAPAAPAIASMTPDTGISATDGITNAKKPTFSGSAEPLSLVTVETLDAQGNPHVLGTVMADVGGAWSYTVGRPSANPGDPHGPGDLGDGSYQVVATATDLAGNVSAIGTPFSLVVDTKKPDQPKLTGISPDSGIVGDFTTNSPRITLQGMAPAGATVALFLNGQASGSAVANGGGTFSLDLTNNPLADGSYVLTFTATDLAGNVSDLSGKSSVVIDSTPPAAPALTALSPDTGAGNSDLITSATQLTFSGTSAVSRGTVQVNIDGVAVGTTTSDDHGNWKFVDPKAVAPGTHNLTAQVTDYVGNTSALSAPAAFVVDTSAPAPPVLGSISQNAGFSASAAITTTSNPTFGGTAEPGSTVTLLNGTKALGTTTADAQGNWQFTVTGGGLGQNTYLISATATDSAGNTSALAATCTLKVITQYAKPKSGTTTPAVSTAKPAASSLLAVNKDGSSTVTAAPVFSGTATANTYVVMLDGSNIVGVVPVDAKGNWTITGTGLSKGKHNISFAALDALGNFGLSTATSVIQI